MIAPQAETLDIPRRRYGPAARLLFVTLDAIYGKKRTLSKFKVLELVARVPYQAWEQAAYIAITHVHERTGMARRIHDRVIESRRQQDNEQWHLLILDELIGKSDVAESRVKYFWIPQAIAVVYYQVSWLLFSLQPRVLRRARRRVGESPVMGRSAAGAAAKSHPATATAGLKKPRRGHPRPHPRWGPASGARSWRRGRPAAGPQGRGSGPSGRSLRNQVLVLASSAADRDWLRRAQRLDLAIRVAAPELGVGGDGQIPGTGGGLFPFLPIGHGLGKSLFLLLVVVAQGPVAGG